jgi:hypothetical protein
VTILPPQADCLLRHSGASAEFVGLDQDAGGELEARAASREARVVLYPRRGTCLPSKGHRFEGEGGKALRGPVDRRAEARRPCPNHHEVVGATEVPTATGRAR